MWGLVMAELPRERRRMQACAFCRVGLGRGRPAPCPSMSRDHLRLPTEHVRGQHASPLRKAAGNV